MVGSAETPSLLFGRAATAVAVGEVSGPRPSKVGEEELAASVEPSCEILDDRASFLGLPLLGS